MATKEPVLQVKQLQKSLQKKRILQDVSFQVYPEEIVGLLGPNGSGKSTLFQTIMGILRPDHGEIRVHGENVSRLPLHTRAKKGLGYLSQEPSIFRDLTVENNLLAILELLPYKKQERLERLELSLMELDLKKVRKKKAKHLSGGERRRLEITRALLLNPSIFLLDEPFANIDPLSIEEVKQLARHLKNKGIGILITDHNARELFSIVDRCYLLFDGTIFFSGTPKELLQNREVKRLYLGNSFAL